MLLKIFVFIFHWLKHSRWYVLFIYIYIYEFNDMWRILNGFMNAININNQNVSYKMHIYSTHNPNLDKKCIIDLTNANKKVT